VANHNSRVKDLNSWKNYNLSLTCYREIFVQPDSIIKPGDDVAMFSPTHANLPECDMDLVRFLAAFRARELKIHMQYESIYGEKWDVVGESWVDQEILDHMLLTFKERSQKKP